MPYAVVAALGAAVRQFICADGPVGTLRNHSEKCVVQGAKLPVNRRPSSPAPPVYQEEYESFFNCQGIQHTLSGLTLKVSCLSLLVALCLICTAWEVL